MYVYPRTYNGIFTYLREVPNKVSGKPIVDIEALIKKNDEGRFEDQEKKEQLYRFVLKINR